MLYPKQSNIGSNFYSWKVRLWYLSWALDIFHRATKVPLNIKWFDFDISLLVRSFRMKRNEWRRGFQSVSYCFSFPCIIVVLKMNVVSIHMVRLLSNVLRLSISINSWNELKTSEKVFAAESFTLPFHFNSELLR